MVRRELKASVAGLSTAKRVGVAVLALIGLGIGNRLATMLQGASDGLLLTAGVATIVLFFGSLYVLYAVVIAFYHGRGQETSDPA